MKFCILFLILLTSITAHARYIDIVFDIDWTLVYPIKDISNIEDTSRLYYINNEYYRLADGAEQVIDDLIKNKNVRVSFFSGGEQSRNINLLKSINLPNSNKTLYEISHKVLSKKDLTVLNSNQELKFFERYKKDLTQISNNLDNIILIDDIKAFTPTGQKRNVLWLGDTFEFTPKFLVNQSSEFLPKTKMAWAVERSKMFWVYEQIDYAIKKSIKNNSSFIDELTEYQKKIGNNKKNILRKAIIKSEQLGLKYKKISKVNFRSFCDVWY